jgi:Cu+-exporting ATPase
LEPGLHWRFPYPIDQVKKLSLDRVRIIEIGFRNLRKPGAAPEGRSWNSPHEGDGYYRVPDESVMITGDGNLMELQGSVRYRIIDPVAYLFHASDPDAMIRAHTEAVLREMVAAKKLGSLLTLDRGNFQTLATTRLASRIQQMGTEGPGIILDGLSLHDMHPPQEVVRSYYAVTQAMELRDRKINDAQASVMLKEADEHGRALQKVRSAEANSGDITRKALAQTEVFLRLLEFKSGPGMLDDSQLILQGLFESIASKNPVQAANKTLKEIHYRRQSWVTLSEFRRFWNTLSGSMAGREKVLLDTDKPIKSNLWMFPLDLIRPSAISTTPTERGKGSRSSGDSPGMG